MATETIIYPLNGNLHIETIEFDNEKERLEQLDDVLSYAGGSDPTERLIESLSETEIEALLEGQFIVLGAEDQQPEQPTTQRQDVTQDLALVERATARAKAEAEGKSKAAVRREGGKAYRKAVGKYAPRNSSGQFVKRT